MKSFSLVCAVCGTVNRMSQTHCLACGQILVAASNSTIFTSVPTVSALSNKLLKQRYRVMHIVGRGGMGTVYIGRDTQLGNRLIAIKEMSQNSLVLSERLTAAKNFQREAHLLARLQHPNLPSIYDHFEEGQRWYLVMSFIKGQTLTDYLATKGGRLSTEEVLEIGIALCSVLEYLHACQPPIIFRDLKPSNIMRTVDGHIYLIDFGIARFFKPGKAVDTANKGSSGYAPPEQYGAAQTTPRSDIYSLGATLYCLLSGYEPAHTPFRFPPLQTLVSTVPPPLVRLITHMLALDEKARPESMEAVRWELQKIARGSDIT
ncbi:MAG TPA: serine/threonine-protein kinase, partial [Ktedonobacteraceae bacterium]